MRVAEEESERLIGGERWERDRAREGEENEDRRGKEREIDRRRVGEGQSERGRVGEEESVKSGGMRKETIPTERVSQRVRNTSKETTRKRHNCTPIFLSVAFQVRFSSLCLSRTLFPLRAAFVCNLSAYVSFSSTSTP